MRRVEVWRRAALLHFSSVLFGLGLGLDNKEKKDLVRAQGMNVLKW